MNKNILELKNIKKSFASVRVLKDISITLKEGSILGLVGENGAGKSTLMNILGGIYQKDDGEILYEGEKFEPNNPKDSRDAGIAFVHQELNLFANLSVTENLFITKMHKNKIGSLDKKRMKREVEKTMQLFGDINFTPDDIVENLSMGQRQMIEIIKSIIEDAKIIIFDEPTTSLSESEKIKLFEIMKKLKKQGKSIVFISHILEDIFEYTDEIAVMRDGEIISQRKTVDSEPFEVIKEMVGRELTNIYPVCEKEIGKTAFVVKNICQQNRFENLNLSISEGEIVGIYGLMGSGRTELLRCIFGLDPVEKGEIFYYDKKIYPLTPENCITNGMAFITENRREEGLLLPKSLENNIVLASLKKYKKNFFFMSPEKEKESTNNMVKDLNIKTANPFLQTAVSLSGGNQQKVVFAKWVLREPDVFLLDEPTRGVDVGAKYEIYTIIQELAKNKSCVLMVSSEVEELIGICDRILVMNRNRIIGELSKNQFDPEKIMTFAVGGIKNE